MAGWKIVLHAMALVVCLVGAHAYSDAGKYLVTAPLNAWPGSSYSLTVQVFGAVSPVYISAYLEGENGYDAHVYQQIYSVVTPAASLSVLPGSVKTLTIQVPKNVHSLTQSNRYRLHVRGTGGLQIEETYSVHIVDRIASVFVQMGKASYTPGETVTFKTFGFYTKDLTPYTGVYDVTLKAENVVFNTWKSISGQAINTFHFDLDTHTIVGAWTVTISNTDTGVTHQAFTVRQKQKDVTIQPATESSAIEVKVHSPKTMNSSTDLTGSFEATWLLSKDSGVTVQQVTLPSGFAADASSLARQSGTVRLVQHTNTNFTVYFNQIQRDSSCYTLTADRVVDVAHTSPGHIYTTSFTKPEYQDITMYQTRRLSDSTVCDICPSCCA